MTPTFGPNGAGKIVLPALGDLAGGLGAGWLVLAVYAALGVLLAVLFRGTGLALGLGLVYVFVIENLLLTLPLPDWFQDAAVQALLTPNALALSRAFGEAAAGPQMIAGAVPGAGRAGAVLAAYVVALCAAGVLVLRRRAIVRGSAPLDVAPTMSSTPLRPASTHGRQRREHQPAPLPAVGSRPRPVQHVGSGVAASCPIVSSSSSAGP